MLGFLVVVAAAGAIALRATWPGAAIELDAAALARVKLAPVGEHVESVSVVDRQGRPVPVRLQQGALTPRGKLKPGERLEVHLTVKRAGWIGWLVGGTKHVATAVVTPQAKLRSALLHLEPGAPVALRFDGPVGLVRLTLPGFGTQRLAFEKPRDVVQTGLRATGANRYGVATVASAARSWEAFSPPVSVSWFPAGERLQALVEPAPGTTIQPTTTIHITFSEPVSSVLGLTRPHLEPATPGTWTQTAANAITFTPTGAGYPLGKSLVLALPAPTDVVAKSGAQTLQNLSWKVPVGSTLRLQQLLSDLGYLPLEWHPAAGDRLETAADQAKAALHAPPGTFTWRYPSTPAELKSLWKAGAWTRMTQGAVMAFEHDEGLAVDGIPGPQVWHALISAALAGKPADHSYSYVLVHRSVPQNLILWNDGTTVMHVKINTGVPAAPTPYGTHAVFEHIPIGTMRGRNPDGSKYVDPGIRWISYFNGGEAIHGFDRATYGFPQSVGCVEAPVATAAKIWPYTPIGTLVSVVP
jgi:L,D-transpeptidase catalytic domain/Putative peptidoglycan binding domain